MKFSTHIARGGLYFKRLEDGSVRIVINENGTISAKKLKEVIIPPEEWADIVTSVSLHGNPIAGTMFARNLHDGKIKEVLFLDDHSSEPQE